MNLKIVSIVLVVLLVGSSGIMLYQYIQNQQLNTSIVELEDELEVQKRRVDYLEKQNRELNTRIQTSLDKISDLEDKISQLEIEIRELKRRNYISVALTFVWNENLGVDTVRLGQIVERMNTVIWDKFHVYFYVFHAGSEEFMPLDSCWGESCKRYNLDGCSLKKSWCAKAWNLYPAKDIPVGMFRDITEVVRENVIGYCAYAEDLSKPVIAVENPEFFSFVELGSQVLAHEILHAFGFSDEKIDLEMSIDLSDNIPLSWMTQIQKAAKAYDMAN